MNNHKTKIIAISGTTGGGKTTTVTELQKRTPNSIALSLEDGDYEKNSGITDLAQWEEDGWDVSLWNLQSLADDIKLLLQKNYEYIFFDYPFGYMQKQISEFISLSVHIDTPLDVALARRTLRDCKNEPTSSILKQLEWYLEKRHLFTISNDFQKNDAELIVDGCLPTDSICKLILEKIGTVL
jgi:uridine kinase